MLSEQELAAIEVRANAAQDGPWAEGWSGGVTGESAVKLGGHLDKNLPMVSRPNAIHQSWRGQHEYIAEVIARTMTTADAAFIAAARTDVPALVAEVRRLRAALAHYADEGNWSPLASPPKPFYVDWYQPERNGYEVARAALGEGVTS